MTTDRPRILWVLPSLEMGGTERQAALLLPFLSRTFEPRVVTLYREGPLAEDLRQSGIPVFCLEGRSLYDLTLGRKLRNFVKDWRPVLVQSLLWDANVRTAWALRRERNIPLLTSRREIGEWRKTRHLWAERWTNRVARRVIVNSEATRRYVCETERLPPEKIEVIYNALDPELEKPRNREEARKRFDLPPDILVLGVIASLAKKKGHRDLFLALQSIGAQISPYRLLVIGEGPEQNSLEKLAKDLNLSSQVQFLGLRRDIPEILSALDILVHPSHSESLPNAVLEAAAMGVPVIATKVGGTPELIPSGQEGILVSPYAPDELGNALLQLAQNPEKHRKLAFQTQKQVRQRFGISLACKAYIELYDQILGTEIS